MTDATKEAHELAVFGEFRQAALSQEATEGAAACTPPQPDIFFCSTSNPRYFELGRLLDAEYSRTVLRALRQAPEPVAPDVMKIKLPERDVLRRKLSKTYDSRGLPIELLLYFDTDHRHLEGGIPPMDFATHAEFVMVPLLRESMGSFTRVWVFERYTHTVLWSYPQQLGKGG